MKIPKIIKKTVKAGKRFVKQRYNIGGKKKGGLNIQAIAQDVAGLARMINAEKKIYSISSSNELALAVGVGQVNATVSGTRIFDISPLIEQNVSASGRTGDSLKITSAYFQFMVSQQANCVIGNRCSIELWHYNGGAVISVADVATHLFKPTVFSTVIDYQSARNEDFIGDFRLARRMVVNIPAEQVSGSRTVRYINMPIKFNKGKGHHIRYTGSTITNNPLTDIANGRSQLFLIYRAESGNRSSVVSTLNVPQTGITTGLEVTASYTMYYYDN